MRLKLLLPCLLLLSCSSVPTQQPQSNNKHNAVSNEDRNSILVQTGNMSESRASHSATLLSNGKVLIAGGFKKGPDGYSQLYYKSTEIYDPQTKSFTKGPDMVTARCGHTATLLKDGRVLFTGGFNESDVIADAEIFDPATNTFTSAGALLTKRGGHTATLLNDGTVLIAGGNRDEAITSEVFDPSAGKFSKGPAMTVKRLGHTATVLNDGRILLAGGETKEGVILSSTELYNPSTGKFTAGPGMSTVRYKHAAIRLGTGDVLIAGGSNEKDWKGKYSSAEVYNVKKKTFEPVSDMNLQHFKFPNAVVMVGNKILIAGGADKLELYDPASSTFTLVAALDDPHYYATATLLGNGEVLLTGGYNNKIQAKSEAWIVKL